MGSESHDEDRPEEPDPAFPDEPQASVGFEPVTPVSPAPEEKEDGS